MVQHTGLGAWFQANFKLARRYGVMNVVALHKVSDLQAAGDSGSRASHIAEGLIAEASTRVIYQQDEGHVRVTRELLGLTEDTKPEPNARAGVSQGAPANGACSNTAAPSIPAARRGGRHVAPPPQWEVCFADTVPAAFRVPPLQTVRCTASTETLATELIRLVLAAADGGRAVQQACANWHKRVDWLLDGR